MRTEKEWRKIVQLTYYARLSLISNSGDDGSEAKKFKRILKKEHGLSETDLQKELNKFKEEVLPKKETIIKQKAAEIISDIVEGLKKLKNGEFLNTDDNREIYHRIQEIIAIDANLANEVLQEGVEKANITHRVVHTTNFCGDDLGGYTYYFSFDN
ncbi:MAG: hypothetical protein IJE59_05395 [Clostridia bacterium]|nr:hypothetical protein [Clostridia bacterium]